ncbi:hypothetical protein Egran_01774 [Elaphomyces granulatus]|uniref:Integral membrane protein n=1 Tax=Elaphomyces granulatus TaxID=519963 RepID=A0A232M259_9EURO|nr:hypothetical protein Egran_01774 [Elaphomyces granulatus]
MEIAQPNISAAEAVQPAGGGDGEKSVAALPTSQIRETNLIPLFTSRSDSATFIRRRGRYVPVADHALKNSLLASVGYLELANAGDFAANVWNDVPVPKYAMALMAIGGALAISLSYYAFKDAQLSWRNLNLLRAERHRLRTENIEDGKVAVNVDGQLNVNFREMGTEIVDRIGMEILMGFGAIAVGIGTFMAIDGIHYRVWVASNLLSGYIGNSPAALYGIANALWSTYIWIRADRHSIAGAKELDADFVRRLLLPRIRTIKLHAAVNGLTGVIAGVASLITATQWWGYVVLLPCILASIWCNYYWRHMIGYERPVLQQAVRIEKALLVQELEFVSVARQMLEEAPASDPLQRLVSESTSLASVVEYIVVNDLFEDLCIRLLQDKRLSATLFGAQPDDEPLTIDSQKLLDADPCYVPRLIEVMHSCIRDSGRKRLIYRQRYLLEALGSYLCSSRSGSSRTSLAEASRTL